MRSHWITGWLLVVLLACSAVEPRAAMADAPAVPASTRDSQKKPTTPPASPLPDPAEQHFRDVFTLSGYTRAQKIEELSAGWSTRKQLLLRAAEFANLTNQSLTRAAASVRPEGPSFRNAGRAIAGIGILATAAIAAPGYPLLHQWLQVLCVFALVLLPGLAIPVLWLVRSQASRGAPAH